MIEEGRDNTIEPSEQFGFEDAFIEIPNQFSSAEGVLNLEPDPFMKRLPHRHNRVWTRIFHVRPHSIGETRFLFVKN